MNKEQFKRKLIEGDKYCLKHDTGKMTLPDRYICFDCYAETESPLYTWSKDE